MNAASIADDIDDLYQRAVEHADDVAEPMLTEWAEAVAETTGDSREKARAVRKAIRTARKLANYWIERDPASLPNWRNGVDEALGGQGWQAQLDVLRAALMSDPDADLFDLVKQRHRAVHFTEWMEGLSFEEWLDAR